MSGQMRHETPIRWNRRTKAAIAARKACTWIRAAVLGQGLSHEAPDWYGPQISFHNGDTTTSVWGCPICAALVFEENRAYHERWHIAGSI